MAIGFALVLLFVLNGADGSHIVGGRDAAPHSRPYMASLQVQGRHICGGALKIIWLKAARMSSDPHVLGGYFVEAIERTWEQRIPYTVVLGADSLSSDEPTKQELSTVTSFPHPNYDGHTNDIMLLKLDGRAQLTEAVQLIRPKRGRLDQCITTGWGDIGDNNTLPSRLQEVNVTILPLTTCRRRWVNVPIARSMVCGTGARALQGFCSGDSGGPLVCNGDAAGIVSFSGRRCGDPRTPDVYTRISFFRSWIRTVLNNN